MSAVVLPATQEVAAKHALPEVDHWNVFLGKPELFVNADHFTPDGIQRMAETVRAALQSSGNLGTGDAGAGADEPGIPIPALAEIRSTHGCSAGASSSSVAAPFLLAALALFRALTTAAGRPAPRRSRPLGLGLGQRLADPGVRAAAQALEDVG